MLLTRQTLLTSVQLPVSGQLLFLSKTPQPVVSEAQNILRIVNIL